MSVFIAFLLGYRVRVAPIDRVDYSVDIDELNGLIGGSTVMLVGSAPNYPYGTMDNIEVLSELALDNGLWLHVDACICGFTLPFQRLLGEEIPSYDFELDGVYSLSADLHKYGYAPKGASLILYRDRGLRVHQIYVNTGWPGYPLVNTTILSSRSAGSLAASWAIINYLGIDGYKRLTRRIMNARDRLVKGLGRLGFRVMKIAARKLPSLEGG